MVKRSFLCWFFGVVYPFFSHFRFQSSFLFFVHLPQVNSSNKKKKEGKFWLLCLFFWIVIKYS
ncbi:hypothetical protein E1A91_D07G091200v1 [Gossypium mustelinum]|uniref:Uncharacterized protein n=1 Tax=Gossypium mustelinum TaxID=34275 RepID=A0A5D2U812_GOSMU|nr:hypothetical protein E1A91_D07G091200v1 [Gossypium mustelinum]